MATFAFKAVDLAGVPARGEVDAESKQAVSDQLRQRGLIVLDIIEKKAAVNVEDFFGRFQKVKSRDLTIMTRQLATMVSSGMSLLRAFYVLEDQTESKLLKEVNGQVRRDIEAGISLSDALEKHPKVFNQLYVAMARTGEAGGILEDTLVRVADQLEKQDSLRRQIKAAMAYPILLSSFAVVVMLALVAFLVPVFEEVFKDFGGELPTITKFSVGLSHLVTDRWYLLIAAVVGGIVGITRLKRSERGRPAWDAFKLRFPMKIGDVVQKVALARWSRTFAGLVHAGVPMLQAIEITGKTAGNAVVERSMVEVQESVKRGGTIAEPLRHSPAFPAMVAHMVGVGEETGNLDGMLTKIADFYEDEVAAAIKALTSILEPVMILVVGGMVGFIIISMYMPMFKVYEEIR
jgi:type IV pilus assembly protein PilC